MLKLCLSLLYSDPGNVMLWNIRVISPTASINISQNLGILQCIVHFPGLKTKRFFFLKISIYMSHQVSIWLRLFMSYEKRRQYDEGHVLACASQWRSFGSPFGDRSWFFLFVSVWNHGSKTFSRLWRLKLERIRGSLQNLSKISPIGAVDGRRHVAVNFTSYWRAATDDSAVYTRNCEQQLLYCAQALHKYSPQRSASTCRMWTQRTQAQICVWALILLKHFFRLNRAKSLREMLVATLRLSQG